jgi:hypothetical protein
MLKLHKLLRLMKSVFDSSVSDPLEIRIPLLLDIRDAKHIIYDKNAISWLDSVVEDTLPRVACIAERNYPHSLRIIFKSRVPLPDRSYPSLDGIAPLFKQETADGGCIEYLTRKVVLGITLFLSTNEAVTLYAVKSDNV